MRLELKDPLSLRQLTEEVDAGPPSRAASEGGMLPQPHTSATAESHPLATKAIPVTPEEPRPSATEVVPTVPRVLPGGTHSAGHSRAPDMSDATRRPEGGGTPVIKTKSGRVVKKPAHYADSGE